MYGGKLEFKGVGVPTPETFAKVGWKGSGDNKRLLSYKICINQTKNKIDNAVVSDTPQEGVKLKRESLRILKGKWVVKLGNYELNPMQDVTDQYTVNWKPDDRGFSINLGNIGEEDGYELWYDAEASYDPTNGEVFKNNAELSGTNFQTSSLNINTVYNIGGGIAEGYVYKIKLHKEDESHKPLKGAKFKVVRDASGVVIGEYETNDAGEIEVSGLL